MIDLSEDTINKIKTILKTYVPECEVRTFGSRVNNTSKKYSDLDIVVIGPESPDWKKIESLKDAFAESNIPIIIDVVNWHNISDEFRKIIDDNYEVLVSPELSDLSAPAGVDIPAGQ